MNFLRQEFRAGWSALLYFTRLPLPFPEPYAHEDLRRAAAYWPFSGWFVGALVAGLWCVLANVLPLNLASGLALAAGVLLTGAMHEDGLADVCDGLGGGTSKERALEIMKDSAVGAFGALGLVLSLGLRWQSLGNLDLHSGPWIILAAFASSRACAVSLMPALDYVRVGPSKARALAHRLHPARLCLAWACGLAPLLFLPAVYALCPVVPLCATFLLGLWFRRRLGGYTGDCLGATQQVAEILFFVSAISLR